MKWGELHAELTLAPQLPIRARHRAISIISDYLVLIQKNRTERNKLEMIDKRPSV